jgi:hypothetical protein
MPDVYEGSLAPNTAGRPECQSARRMILILRGL